jgi:hypothetical protein
MKRQTKTLRLFTVILSLALSAPFFALGQGSKADFSGSWVMNESKSDQGGGGGMRFGGGNFTAKQEANLLTVDRTRTNQDGETMTITSKYTLDGKESVNSTGFGDSKSTAKWSDDGKSLTIVTISSFNGEERKSTEVWTLTDAKTITIISTRPGRDGGETKTTRVYDKK